MSEQKNCWSEVIPEPDEAVFNALIAICIERDANWYEAVGTGFVVGAGGTVALVVSAAHVFEQIHRRQNPRDVEKHTVFNTLHPSPQKLDLDPEKVFGFVFRNGQAHRLKFLNLHYELRSDFAMFEAMSIDANPQPIFTHNIGVDDELPTIGTAIEGIGFKHMIFAPHMDGGSLKIKFAACLTRRTGTVSEVHPAGNMRLKVPCFTATFPIFGGMSGGPVLKIGSANAPAACGLLSSDFEDDVETKYDQAKCGTTNVAKLPVKWIDTPNGRELEVRFVSDEIGSDRQL
ncbi:serine protease [Massilia sp. IC2-476]|uniref:S1 family peptidase n=1 Tax=Massilia sp. IC2-476 TaxID=2887199 RepID=UPI001D1123E3|nr:serine protease [Massilia sp. IC2-476]MCC2973268.1 serine protease [Massilia sp. IC2-476]